MKKALIGFSGFVGSTLVKQTRFSDFYRSTNIQEIDNKEFDTIVCAGAPAQKWIANKNPEEDLKKINGLIGHLETVKCKQFILVSTVDVFKQPVNVDEETAIDETGLHAYGLHRRLLEKFVDKTFETKLIIRLPGLVGPGLRKNIIFDFLNNNNLDAIESRSVFQFYPMVNLWYDIEVALEAKLSLVHLTSAPISVSDVSLLGFGKAFTNTLAKEPVLYDMRTKYAPLFGSSGNYQYSVRETVEAIRSYAQSEPLKLEKENGGK
ncbi:hypothetical protein [uncultured Bartonella sp.]|uniref:hypothetical protein n=1 Tax=uncultured Bartonella sp. TaxID=104108 RepID=UPI0025DEEAB4|nr:hypothetical protein [uncultured Bartonella sp.]